METEKELMVLKEVSLRYKVSKRRLENKKVLGSESAYRLLLPMFSIDTIGIQEQFNVLLLNKANVPIGLHRVSTGGIDSVSVDIRHVIAVAIKTMAIGIIISHNHPSGNISGPSAPDLKLTSKLKDACKFFDITLLDHLIISPIGGYFSLADRGML